MPPLYLAKRGGMFFPLTEDDAAHARKIANGEIVECEIRRKNDIRLHRRLFALFQAAYSFYCEEMDRLGPERPDLGEYHGTKIQAMSFDAFRKLITVKAGYHVPVFKLDGGVQLVPQSLSFQNCDDALKERIYSDVLDTVIRLVFNSDQRMARGERVWLVDEINDWVNRLVRFSR